MLTSEHSVFTYKRGRIIPDRLNKKDHAHYLQLAEKMAAVYHEGIGKSREMLHREIRDLFAAEPHCPPRRIAAFCKLLDDGCIFLKDIPGKASVLRRKVFRAAAPHHPLVTKTQGLFKQSCLSTVQEEIAAALNRKWAEIDSDLFADVIENHRLMQGPDFARPEVLLSRYNVAQIQTCLYRARRIYLNARADLKTIMHTVKREGLMFRVSRKDDESFQFVFDGVASILRNTQRYGVRFAAVLPTLLSCRDWRLTAEIGSPKSRHAAIMELDSHSGLSSGTITPDVFDSGMEKDFAAKWGEGARKGWRLTRDTDFLFHHQHIFFPDFIFTHDDGRRVFLEIAGFWTPEYFREKIKVLERFRDRAIILAASAANRAAGESFSSLSFPIIHYKKSLLIQDVLAKLLPSPPGCSGNAEPDAE